MMNRTTLTTIARGRKTMMRVGEVRDGLLVLGAVLYGFGYTAFSIFAWVNHLGAVPGVEAQYFIAGIPVLVVVVLGVAVALTLYRLYTTLWPEWYEAANTRTKWLTSAIIGITLLAFVAYFYVWGPASTQHRTLHWWDVVSIIVLAFVSPLFRWPSRDLWLLAVPIRAQSVIAAVYVVVLALLGASLYLRFVYPLIPQALGGGAARAAIISLDTEKLPPPTAQLLIGRVPAKDEKAAVSRRLFVFVATKECVIVALRQREPGKPWDLFEIDRSAVLAIRWVV